MRASTPGRKFSTSTSDWRISRVRISRPSGLSQIQTQRTFVAIELGEIPREPIADRTLTADRVTLRRLDLQDVGAEIAEQRGAERARQNPGKIEHPDAGQLHVRFLFAAAYAPCGTVTPAS